MVMLRGLPPKEVGELVTKLEKEGFLVHQGSVYANTERIERDYAGPRERGVRTLFGDKVKVGEIGRGFAYSTDKDFRVFTGDGNDNEHTRFERVLLKYSDYVVKEEQKKAA